MIKSAKKDTVIPLPSLYSTGKFFKDNTLQAAGTAQLVGGIAGLLIRRFQRQVDEITPEESENKQRVDRLKMFDDRLSKLKFEQY